MRRLFGDLKPINTRHEIELLRIAELDALASIDRLNRQLAVHYIDNQLKQVEAVALLLIRHHESLIICLKRTEEANAKLIREGQAPKSTKLDYTRFDEMSY